MDSQERLISVWSLEIADGEIRSISSVVNPDKLAHLGVLAPTSHRWSARSAEPRYADRSRTAPLTTQEEHP